MLILARRCAILAAGLLAAAPLAAADGDPDPTFWGDGRMNLPTSLAGEFQVGRALAAPDGALVVTARRVRDETKAWYWRRLTDTTSTGCELVPPGSTDVGGMVAAAFDAEGRLLVAGGAYAGDTAVIGVARVLYPSCNLDLTFGDEGYATYDVTAGGELATAVALDTEGHIFVAAIAIFPSAADVLVVALDAGGVLRDEFSDDGWVRVDLFGDQVLDLPLDLRVQADGKLVAAGTYEGVSGTGTEMFAVRFTPDGELDETFSGDGMVSVSFGTGDAYASDLAVDPPTGRLALIGYQTDEVLYPAIAVLGADGELDGTFAGDGRMSFGYPGTASALLVGGAFDGLGRLVLGASVKISGSNHDFGAVRLLPSGGLDPTFGTFGRATLAIDEGNPPVDYATAFALQGGRAVVAGDIYLADMTNKPGVVRFEVSLAFADGFEAGMSAAWTATVP